MISYNADIERAEIILMEAVQRQEESVGLLRVMRGDIQVAQRKSPDKVTALQEQYLQLKREDRSDPLFKKFVCMCFSLPSKERKSLLLKAAPYLPDSHKVKVCAGLLAEGFSHSANIINYCSLVRSLEETTWQKIWMDKFNDKMSHTAQNYITLIKQSDSTADRVKLIQMASKKVSPQEKSKMATFIKCLGEIEQLAFSS